MTKLLLLAVLSLPALAADVCNPRDFHGTYGFQLSGDTRISGDTKPTASIGRLVFNETGGVGGYSSAQFAGYLQGNPVNGSFEAHTDCSLDWSLQDDSGAFQHFSGKMTPDTMRIEFRQTDAGGPQHGIMIRTPASCSPTSLLPRYEFSISGSFTPMLAGQEAHLVSRSGTARVADGGKFTIVYSGNPAPAEGTFEVDGECTVTMDLSMKLRGILVNEGKEILAIQTDPGATVTARFTAK